MDGWEPKLNKIIISVSFMLADKVLHKFRRSIRTFGRNNFLYSSGLSEFLYPNFSYATLNSGYYLIMAQSTDFLTQTQIFGSRLIPLRFNEFRRIIQLNGTRHHHFPIRLRSVQL